ncbi:MAG: hypothetical protein WC091_02035 [Sulfuricellaceae bacterium]
MPNLSALKSIPMKLWGFLLSDKSSFVLVTFALCVTLALIFNVDIFLADTRFRTQWVLYLVPAVILIYHIYCAFRIFVWLRNFKLEKWLGRPSDKSQAGREDGKAVDTTKLAKESLIYVLAVAVLFFFLVPGGELTVIEKFDIWFSSSAGAFLMLLVLGTPKDHKNTPRKWAVFLIASFLVAGDLVYINTLLATASMFVGMVGVQIIHRHFPETNRKIALWLVEGKKS